MNYVAKVMALAFIFVALGSSAMAVSSNLHYASNGGTISSSLAANSESSGTNSIVAKDNTLSINMVNFAGPFLDADTQSNTAGAYAGHQTYVDWYGVPQLSTAISNHRAEYTVTPTSVSYSSSLSTTGAQNAYNGVYTGNAEGDFSGASVSVDDQSGIQYWDGAKNVYGASLANSWGLGYASNNAAFSYMQFDSARGQYADAQTNSWINDNFNTFGFDGIGSDVHVGDPNSGYAMGNWNNLPSISNYQSYTQTTNGEMGVAMINKATLDAPELNLPGGERANGEASVYGVNSLGYSWTDVQLPDEGLLQIDSSTPTFGYFDAKNTVSNVAATVGGTALTGDRGSYAAAGSLSGPNFTPASKATGKGSGTYGYTAFAYSGLTDLSGGAKVTVTAI